MFPLFISRRTASERLVMSLFYFFPAPIQSLRFVLHVFPALDIRFSLPYYRFRRHSARNFTLPPATPSPCWMIKYWWLLSTVGSSCISLCVSGLWQCVCVCVLCQQQAYSIKRTPQSVTQKSIYTICLF